MLEFRRLDILLSEISQTSREFSKELILNGLVKVNGKVIKKPGVKLEKQTNIEFELPKKVYVSRGGFKLEEALRVYNINLEGKICLDVGSSTGGYTDCMLQNGAAKVFAIDTGTAQLSEKLRNDCRVVSMENTNINDVSIEIFQKKVDFIAVDVSFVSLTKVLSKVYAICNPHTKCVFLVKPQFEVGRGKINKNGVVKKPLEQKKAVKDVSGFAKELGFLVIGVTPSPIQGAKGNKEFLLYAEVGSI